jgi:hypothetical protein
MHMNGIHKCSGAFHMSNGMQMWESNLQWFIVALNDDHMALFNTHNQKPKLPKSGSLNPTLSSKKVKYLLYFTKFLCTFYTLMA